MLVVSTVCENTRYHGSDGGGFPIADAAGFVVASAICAARVRFLPQEAVRGFFQTLLPKLDLQL
jgi:hypothetical protein